MYIMLGIEIAIILISFKIHKKKRWLIQLLNIIYGIIVILLAPRYGDPGFGDMIVVLFGILILFFSLFGLLLTLTTRTHD